MDISISRLFLFIILPVLVKPSLHAQDWFEQPRSASYDINSVYFADGSSGWMVGSAGIILHSTNGGVGWQQQDAKVGFEWNDVFFANNLVGWVAGAGGAIYKTFDGGENWIPQLSGTNNTINAVHFLNADTGWAVCMNGTVLHTEDGGETWVQQTIGSTHFNAVYFATPETGWVCGFGGKIFKTIDGGANWIPQNSTVNSWLQSLNFVDENTGWAVGWIGTILKTVDGGATWNDQSAGQTAWFTSVDFIDANTGWAAGSDGTILHTVDGGATWTPMTIGIADTWIRAIYIRDGGSMWAAGDDGLIIRNSGSHLSISSQLSIGLCGVTNTSETKLLIWNSGNQALAVNNILSDIPEITIDPTTAAIPPGQSVEITLTFAPTAIQRYDAQLTFQTDVDGNHVMNIAGYGIAPEPAFAPSVLSLTNITPSSIRVSYNEAADFPDGYVVTRGKTNAIPVLEDGIEYHAGDGTENYTIIHLGSEAPVIDFGLQPETKYYYYVFSYNGSDTVINYSSAFNSKDTLTLYVEPLSQARDLSFSNVTPSSFAVSFHTPVDTLDGFLVVRRPGSAVSFIPQDGINYAEGMATGDHLIVSIGTDTVLTEAGLDEATEYFYAVYAFNQGVPGSINYLTATPMTGSQFTLTEIPPAQPSLIRFDDITANSMKVIFNKAPMSANGYLAMAKAGSLPSSFPANAHEYSTGDAIGDGRVVYVGTDSQFVTTGLNPATEYFINVFSFNGDDLSTHYLTTSPLQGRQFTYASEPLEQPTDLLFSNITTTSCVVTFRQPSMRATGYLAIRHEGSFSAEIPVNGRKYSLGEELISGKVVAMGRDTSFVDTGLQEGAEYFYTIYAFNGDSQTCNFKIDAPLMGSKLIALQPQVLSLQLSEPISEENTAIVIRVQVSGTNPEVTLIYGNNANALEKELIFQNNLTDFTAQIPAEDVVSAGLWYRIKVTNAAGTAFSPSATGYYDLPVTIKDFNSIKQISHFSGGIPKEQWLLTGLPFETDDVYFSDVFGEQKQNKKNEAVNWLVKELNQDFRETVSMRNEKGYAVYHRLSTYKFFDEVIANAVSRPRGAFDAIDLKPGWNLVAWPYAFEGNIQIKDVSKVRFIWTLNSDGGWESSGALRVKPYDAFLINNKSGDGTVESVLDWSVAPLGKSSAAGDPAGWSVPFILKTSAVSDRNNELGVSDNALDGWDVWDEDEPVNLTDVPQIYFVLAENDQMRRLAYDIRPSQTNGNVWEMVVDGISTKNDRLEWNLQNIPSTLAIAIVNTSINRWLDPAAQSVPLDPSITLQRFKIIIGQPTFVHDAVESIKENLPEQFELFSNFPNPFNPTTQIRFRVARSGNLDLKIFNILGQEVKTLTNGFYETGDYKVSWDGTDNRGLRVSSGIYFYRIKTASFLQTKKMILIK